MLSPVLLAILIVVFVAAIISYGLSQKKWGQWYGLLERHGLVFTILALVAILIGGAVEIIPTIVVSNKVPVAVTGEMIAENPELAETAKWLQQPYTPLELAGRDVYISEGCYLCHSQMIRPFRHEVLRYGDYSRMEESLLDFPFQWGSKRTGLDLARVGGKYDHLWHYLHLMDPRSTSPASNMPTYGHFKTKTLDPAVYVGRMRVLAKLGVPYTDEDFARAEARFMEQGREISDYLAEKDVNIAPSSQMAAVIAYLQRLGKVNEVPAVPTAAPVEDVPTETPEAAVENAAAAAGQ